METLNCHPQRSDLQCHVTDLLVGSVSDILQLSDEAVDHQRLLQLLLVVVQIAVKLTPPEEGFDCQTGSSREAGGRRRAAGLTCG